MALALAALAGCAEPLVGETPELTKSPRALVEKVQRGATTALVALSPTATVEGLEIARRYDSFPLVAVRVDSVDDLVRMDADRGGDRCLRGHRARHPRWPRACP